MRVLINDSPLHFCRRQKHLKPIFRETHGTCRNLNKLNPNGPTNVKYKISKRANLLKHEKVNQILDFSVFMLLHYKKIKHQEIAVTCAFLYAIEPYFVWTIDKLLCQAFFMCTENRIHSCKALIYEVVQHWDSGRWMSHHRHIE